MKKFIIARQKLALQEGKDELDICGLEWNDSFYDCHNYSPDFDFGEEEHAQFFYGCMVRIYELDAILTELNKVK